MLYQYANINDYKNFIHTFGIKETLIQKGCIYSFKYDIDPYNIVDKQELKFSDQMPLLYVCDINTKMKTFTGFNLHHMPLKERVIWYNRISIILNIERFIKLKKTMNRSMWLTYNKIKILMKRSIRVVRQYNMKKVTQIMKIPFENLEEILKFYSKTHYGATMDLITTKYFQNS